MENKIIIRFSNKKDLDQLPWLYRQYFNGDSGLETNIEGMYKEWNKLANNEDYKFISAIDGERLVGFCSVVVNHDIVEKQKTILMLWNLRVHPEYRNNGIGKDIIKFIEDYGKTIDADFIFLGCDKENEDARKFYHKIGYSEDYGFYKYL